MIIQCQGCGEQLDAKEAKVVGGLSFCALCAPIAEDMAGEAEIVDDLALRMMTPPKRVM
jgi:hypothetical protein